MIGAPGAIFTAVRLLIGGIVGILYAGPGFFPLTGRGGVPNL